MVRQVWVTSWLYHVTQSKDRSNEMLFKIFQLFQLLFHLFGFSSFSWFWTGNRLMKQAESVLLSFNTSALFNF